MSDRSARAMMVAGSIARLSYALGLLLAPDAMSKRRLAASTRDNAIATMTTRAFGAAHQPLARWADAVAATVIALDITHDGWTNLSAATRDLMDERPMRYDGSRPDPLQDKVDKRVAAAGWVKEHRVRLREEGHVYTGEVTVVPRSESELVSRLERLRDDLLELHWKLHDIAVVPASQVDTGDPHEQDRPGSSSSS